MKQHATTSTSARNAQLRRLDKWILLAVMVLVPLLAQGQSNYVWIGTGGDSNWGTPGNWNPLRDTPAVTDVLQFNSPATVTNVPTQTIGRLVITNSAVVTLQAAALGPQTLLINAAGVGTNSINIDLGASLGFSGTTPLNITLVGNLNVNGSLLFNPLVAQNIAVGGNLSGGGSINISSGDLAHTLTLSGANNIIGGLITAPAGNSTVHYNRGGTDPTPQQVFAANYNNLTVSNSATKNLSGSTTVSKNFSIQTSTLQTGGSTLTVSGASYLFGTLAINSTAARVNLQYVELRGQIGGGLNPQPGTVTVSGNCDVNANSVINVANLSVLGATRVMPIGGAFRSLTINSAIGSKTFNDLHVMGWGGFYNTANAPLTITGDLTSVNPNVTWGTGMYTFSGSNKTINLVLGTQATLSDYTFENATFLGGYTATGTDVMISNPVVAPGARFTNNTAGFPLVLPGSLNNVSRAFNNSSLAFVNKFDRLAASNHPGNSITANATDLTFSRAGNGAAYALRSRDLSPLPTTAIVRFSLQGTTVNATATAAGTLMLGSNLLDDQSTTGALASININLTNTTGNGLTVSCGSTTSPEYSNPNGEFWWVVNNSTANQTYTTPNGINRTIARQIAELWYNGVLITTTPQPVTSGPIGEIKFVRNGGSGTIRINNLRLNPIVQLTTPSICWYAGRPLTINANVTTSGPGGAFNAGTTFSVQRSDVNGNFSSDRTQGLCGTFTPVDPNAATTFAISTTFPDFYSTTGTQDLGSNYRYRVVSSDLPVVSPSNTNSMYYIINPGPETVEPNFPTLATVTSYGGTTLYWGYRHTSNNGSITKIGGTDNRSTHTPTMANFPGPGEYYLVAVSSSNCISNEKKITVNCSGTSNLIRNGDFSKVGQIGVGLGLGDVDGDGAIIAANGDFESDYIPRDPGDTEFDGKGVGSMQWGSFTVGLNPKAYWSGFCDMNDGSKRAPTKTLNKKNEYVSVDGENMLIGDGDPNGSKILWRQRISGLKQNTNYVFTFWGASLHATLANALQFAIYVDCYRLGDDIADNYASSCNWTKYSVQLNTGNATEFTLSIGNISVNGNGNDVGIDNIEFYECAGSSMPAVNFNQMQKFVWLGYSSDWFNSDNWGVCAPRLPTCGDDVTIPATLEPGRVYPVITRGYPTRNPASFNTYTGNNINGATTDANINVNLPGTFPQVKSILLEAGATLTINDDQNLRICGNIVNHGNIRTSSTGSITFFGNAAQSVSGTGTFNNVTIDQGVRNSIRGRVNMTSNAQVNGLLDLRKAEDVLVINGNTLFLNGTLSNNNGTITGSSTSRLVVGGAGDVGGPLLLTSPDRTLASLTINRASNGQLTLGSPLTLVGGANALTLANGLINTTSTALLTLNAASTVTGSSSSLSGSSPVSGGSNLSHINGPMAKVLATANANNHFTFPVGDQGSLGQISVSPSTAAENTYRARYIRQSPVTNISDRVSSPLNHISGLEYWTLTGPSGINDRVTLHWTTYSDVAAAPPWSELRVARYTGSISGITPLGGVDEWQSQGPSVGIPNALAQTFDYTRGYVTSDVVSGLGAFTIGSTTANSRLPVEWVSLKATPTQEGKVNVSWITASEKNASHFLVQHSTDGRHFRTIGQVQAKGQTSAPHSYQFVHHQPAPFNYYRLSSVDKDASSSLSSLVTAQLQAGALSAPLLYPNPSDGKQLFVKTPYSDKVGVVITSLVGVEVFRQSLLPQQGLLSLRPNLPKGTYLVSLKEGNITTHIKLIVRE